MNTDTIILATAWINQPALSQRPARTILVGAAKLAVYYRFGSLGFDLQAHSSTITDDPDETLAWLAAGLHVPPGRLLLWRAGDIAVPSLIAACESARDTLTGAKLLSEFNLAISGEVVDVADGHGGANASSFDAVAHAHGLPFTPMSRVDLGEAHRTGNHGLIRQHLATRAKAIWQLWLRDRDDSEALIAATGSWLATANAEVRL